MAADESYPDDLRYHSEHDWARIEGDEAELGITWHAQDALGEIVHYEPPEVGAQIQKDRPYGEVESGQWGPCTLLANEDPYGEGWLLRIRLADAGEVDQLLDAAGYQTLLGET